MKIKKKISRERSRSKGAVKVGVELNKKHRPKNELPDDYIRPTKSNEKIITTKAFLNEFKTRPEQVLSKPVQVISANLQPEDVDIVELAKKILDEKKQKKEEEAQALSPRVIIKKVTYLGEMKMDPDEYVQMYGRSLVKSEDLPEYIKKLKTPKGIELAANYNRPSYDSIEKEIISACVKNDYQVRIDDKKSYFTDMNFYSMQRPMEIIRQL